MGYCPDDTDYVDTWAALEQLVRDGLVRSLGVSNFNSEQLTRLLEVATIKPVTNQVECSPNLSQGRLREFSAKHGIVLTAYGPLTRPHRTAPGQHTALNDPIVLSMAERYSKSPAQICLKFLVWICQTFLCGIHNKNCLVFYLNCIFRSRMEPCPFRNHQTSNASRRTLIFSTLSWPRRIWVQW